jgi:amino acid adenylation domain-containing protein
MIYRAAYLPSEPISVARKALSNMPERDRGIRDAYPLTPLQTGLLYEDLATGPGAARPYVIQQIDIYTGRTDLSALVGVYEGLVLRHPIWRTGFAWDGDEPYQFVVDSASLPVTRLDWSTSVPEDQREAKLAALVAADRRLPFDMTRAPLARLTVITLSEDKVLTLFSIHHILQDDWSETILDAEFDELYRAAVEGRAADLPEAPRFGDYIRWQSELRQTLDDKRLRFWDDYLAGMDETRPVCLGRPRSDAPFERACAVIGPEDRAQLEGFARSARVSLPTVLYGAWALVLAVLTGSDDVAFGFTAASRPQSIANAQSLVGPCISTLPLRLAVDPSQQLRGWLRGIMRDLADLWDDETLALVDSKALSRRATVTRNPIESILAVQSTIPRAKRHLLPGTVKTRIDSIEWTGYPITIFVHLADELQLDVTIDGTLGDATAAQALAERLKRILLQFTDPDTQVGELDVLAPAERGQLLSWGTGIQADLDGTGLAERFEDQARRAPHAVALDDGAEPVTYAELNARANRLARLLSEHGAAAETFVAVAMERSTALITAFLAIIKTGAAYAPIPAAYPLPLALDVLRDINPVLLLTDQALHGTPVVDGISATGLPVITADHPAITLSEDTSDLRLPCHLDQAAYVMFTSGSTGTPKGVTVTQGNILTLTEDACWRNGNHRRVLMHSPHSFDAATYEMWVPLLVGDTVILYPPGPLDPAHLERTLTSRKVTALYLTKALFDLLITEIPDALAHLREIWTGGEEASARSVNRAADRCPELSVVNVYGPTETTVFAAYHVTGPDAPYGGTVSCGRPMDNTRVYILDRNLRLLPAGVTGGLYVSGPRVARGYYRRAATTAARFVPDPFGAPGSRMYRTGDLARWTHDGQIEFGGRTDDQVKIRGFRVELGEIETHLASYPAIARAAVIVREDQPGDKRLTAYLVPGSGQDVEHAAVHRYLAQRLPAFMLPAAYVTLPELPLTAHRKVDRKSLPAPAAGHAADGPLAATPTEELLASLYTDILGLTAAPGTDQDFFALGGHSLLAMRLINQIRTIYATDLTIRDLFDRPTIETLARHLDTTSTHDPTEVPLTSRTRGKG